MAERNALAELAERLKNGIYNNPNDTRFDKPVVCASLDANDVLNAQRIVEELAKVREWFIETANKQGNDGKVGCHYFKTRCYIAFKECRKIAEKGAEDERSAK